jgi:AcrR family transcriptional regulator
MSKGTDTRAKIVETALRSASIDGIEGITLGRVASDVGMSKSGLFAHFDSKEALQVDVLNAAAQKFAEVVASPAFKAPRGEPRVRALFERWLEWERHESLPGGCVFMHAAAELDDRPGPAHDALVDWQRRWMETLTRAVQMSVDVGHFRNDLDAALLAFQIHGIVLVYYHAARLLRDPEARSKALAAFENLVIAARSPDRAGD